MQFWKSVLVFCFVQGVAGAAAFQVRVENVEGEVEVVRDGADSGAVPLAGGEILGENDRLYTGMESRATLSFPDGSSVVVQELTDMKIATLDQKGDAVKTRLWLKAGEVSAEVTHDRPVAADFQIKTPTATCSVRGTQFTVRHTVQGTFTYTTQGLVNTASANGQSTNTGAGQQNQAGNDGELEGDTELQSDDAQSDTSAEGTTSREDDTLDGEFQTVTPPVNVADYSNPSGGNNFIQQTNQEVNQIQDEVVVVPPPDPTADPEFRSLFMYESNNAQIHTGNLGTVQPSNFTLDSTFASITTQGGPSDSRGFVSREIQLGDGWYKVTGVINLITREFGSFDNNDLFVIEVRPQGTAFGSNDAVLRTSIGVQDLPLNAVADTDIPEEVIFETTAKQTGWISPNPVDNTFEATAGTYVLEASIEDVGDSSIDSAALIDNLDVVPTEAPSTSLAPPLP